MFGITKVAIGMTTELKTLLEFPPATLNPRLTTDATGQRLNMLMFRALTRIDADLAVKPDLAKSWNTSPDQKIWTFELHPAALDHQKNPIRAHDLKTCLEEYLDEKPVSPLKASFPNWQSAKVISDSQLQVTLTAPDPFLLRNLSVLRFFRVEGEVRPCKNPNHSQTLIGNGPYRLVPWSFNPERTLRLESQNPQQPHLVFEIIKDETSRLLKLLKGDVDFLQNSFSPTKTDWIIKNHGDRFKLLEREGVNISYLAFNLNDPILSVIKVRQAITYAIDRELIIQSLIKNFASIAGSFLSPAIPGAVQFPFTHDLKKAEALLDEAGFTKDKNGIRFRIQYKTTPSKDGFEVAQVFQSMLKKVGIQLDLQMVDPAVFFASIRKGHFQLYSSRWVGVSDASILGRTLQSKQADNRVHYQNAEVDRALLDLNPKNLTFIQNQMAKDLPYFPLWFWSNSLIMRKEIRGMDRSDLSLSGSFTPWSLLKKAE
jgi:peptide/nickel transport system substrate-binding protein